MPHIVSGPTGGAHNRLEIHDFIKDEKFFSLYIQALQAIQEEKESELLSYFRIGGIHALPYVAWDNVGESGKGGYCAHGTVLFPTWHRVYVSLYEQEIQKHARAAAAKYTVDPDGWKEAGEKIRQPYWDWAVNAVPPDEVIALELVTIVTPEGKKEVENPLRRYTFKSPHFEGSDWDWHNTTIRYPAFDGRGVLFDDVDRLRKVLKNEQGNITRSVSYLFNLTAWEDFSNHTVGPGRVLSNSLEIIHDNIHGKIGGGGHMSDPAAAGFDPIFHLHHANVDRVFSLWSALNPDVWVTPGYSGKVATPTIPPNFPIDKDTDLSPFSKDKGKLWTSAGISDTAKLGYTYPEFNGLDLGNKEAVKKAIGDKVRKLYPGPNQRRQPAPIVDSTTSAPHPEHEFHEWTARVTSKQFELPSSYTVLLFLGEVPDDTKEWPVSPKFVGCHSAFVNSAARDCENCRNNTDLVIEGYVHLNQTIAEKSGLPSFEPDVVVPYLTKNLHWHVLKLNGERAKLESLEITVYSTLLKPGPVPGFPEIGKPHRYDSITYGREGGSRNPPDQ